MKIIIVLLSILLTACSTIENSTDENGGLAHMNNHNKINYIEIPAQDIESAKVFFGKVFGWSFIDYGPDYSSFTGQGVDGGFVLSDLTMSTKTGSALIVFYSNNLELTQANVESAGGSIVKPIFSFPGGRRFHFTDTNENEYAVWSE